MAADILILTIYFICVLYVLYQMALSVEAKLEDQVKIVLDGEALKEAVTAQLEAQTAYSVTAEVLEEKGITSLKLGFTLYNDAIAPVALTVTPQGKQPLEPAMTSLVVTLGNGLPDQQVFINWDSSSLSTYGGLAQRVIRMVPGMPVDLFQPQVMTVANPGQAVSVTVTSEHLFTRPEDKQALTSGATLVDFNQVLGLKEPMRQYSLRILLLVQPMTRPGKAMQLLVPLNFKIEVLPDHVALPVLSWLLSASRPKPKQKVG